MDIIIYECLKGFQRRYTQTDSKPKLINSNAFKNLIKDDYSAKNLIAKIIITDEYWENMLNTKGFGKVKYDKANAYRKELITTWNTIEKIFKTKNEAKISKCIGLYLWDLEEHEFIHSYLGVIQEAINQKKLWKSNITSDIFRCFFGFTKDDFKSLDEIAKEYNVEKERVRQLKDECLDNFENDFWFLKDNLFKEKLKNIFDLSSHKLAQIKEQTDRINKIEGVAFSKEFYTKILSITFDMVLIGNINDIKTYNRRSSNGNIWNNLYLQTYSENERCNLESLIDTLAITMHNYHYYFEKNLVVDISPFVFLKLNDNEISRYNTIINTELEVEVELKSDTAIIKRNSYITQPEMVEEILRELGGLAYADEILEKITESFPEKNWTMPLLRASFRGKNFYSIGKSGLFGLKDVKDVRSEMGDGTLNEVIYIFMKEKDSPVHIQELINHINNLFPRPKTLHSIHTILGQNNKSYFKKFSGGFYGLNQKDYKKTEFPIVYGGHANSIKKFINKSEGIRFKDIFKTFNSRFDLLEIQIKYLLNQMISAQKISFTNGLYHPYVHSKIVDIEEIDEKFNDEEFDYNAYDETDIPDELKKDIFTQIKIRRGQPKFRKNLLKFYKNKCIITECDITELLEAAHVLPYSEKKNYSISNGLLLRADIHTLFDLNLIAIDPYTLKLQLNPILIKSKEYGSLNNIDIGSRLKKLHNGYKINEEGLHFRWKSFAELE